MATTYEEWLEDLAAIPSNLQIQWIKDSLEDKDTLHIFGRYFFPHIIKGEDDVPECHLDLIWELSSPGDSGIVFPRGFAKSTWEKIDTIHDIVYSLEPVILYIGGTMTDAKFHFESIKAEFENNNRLISVYGDLVPEDKIKGKKWTNSHFETTNNVNVVARGAGRGRGVNIKNQRPTKIIGDDIENDENVRSAEQRTKLHNWLYNVIFPSLDPQRGKIKMIGTVLHEQAEVLLFYKKHGGIFRKAIENGKSIWSAMWPLEKLEAMKNKIGTRAFAQEYMNNPTSDEMANFNPLWIDDNTYTRLPEETKYYKAIHMDPQAGETGQSDEYAITVLVWTPKSPHRYVVEQIAGRATQLDQAKILIETWLRHKEAHVVGVEKVLNQTAVYQFIIQWKNEQLKFAGVPSGDRSIPVKGVSPKDAKSKYGNDKLGRLQMFEPNFERGEIHLRPEMKTLRDQILFLGKGVLEHDDRADSLVGALELSYRGGFGSTEEIVYNGENDSENQTIAGNVRDMQF